MRGKPVVKNASSRDSGITPADAGKTAWVGFLACSFQDHPRGCGENRYYRLRISYPSGSPPRMRGKQLSSVVTPLGVGITPADAGKTLLPAGRRNAGQDHPRGCGENCFAVKWGKMRYGSPPRMRGKRLSGLNVIMRQRITPADAGKTSLALLTIDAVWDHPRGCGENTKKIL